MFHNFISKTICKIMIHCIFLAKAFTESKSEPESLLLSESESIKGWFFRLPMMCQLGQINQLKSHVENEIIASKVD